MKNYITFRFEKHLDIKSIQVEYLNKIGKLETNYLKFDKYRGIESTCVGQDVELEFDIAQLPKTFDEFRDDYIKGMTIELKGDLIKLYSNYVHLEIERSVLEEYTRYINGCKL